jgi:DNA polymerase I-like protein with 3'-5' exonuclease and polymerase domains
MGLSTIQKPQRTRRKNSKKSTKQSKVSPKTRHSIQIAPTTYEAYQLLHNGAIALSEIQMNGMKVDIGYCKQEYRKLNKRLNHLTKSLYGYEAVRRWKHKHGKGFSLQSNKQLADLLYNELGHEPAKFTDTGEPSTSQEALELTKEPFIDDLIEYNQKKKVRNTYLRGIIKENVDGYVHPFFNLNLTQTYRSCVAKGSKVLAVRDYKKYPDGVPIEKIKVGDYVYCYDDDLKPTIKKVLWAGKTGHKKVVRVHWKSKNRTGYLDVTPEHLIRKTDGSYIRADEIMTSDLRSEYESKHVPKRRILSCHRYKDELNFTGHIKNGRGIKEHRFVYKYMKGSIRKDHVIHHKDENHLNHEPSNLQKTTLSKHSKKHCINTICTKKSRNNNIKAIKKNWADGIYKQKYGFDNPSSLKLSKLTCLKELAKAKGNLTKVSYGFTVFKWYANYHNIDIKNIKLRYDKNGKYISKNRLKNLIEKHGRNRTQKILGHNYYKLIDLCEYYNIPINRKWANQFGEFTPGNHVITDVEHINKYIDVYDLEVEDCHNFIANELCVHNSSDAINFQNLPIRNPVMGPLVRKAIIADKNFQIVELDYSGIEVMSSEWYHKDPNMFTYLEDKNSDMHKDTAIDIYLLSDLDKNTCEKEIRKVSKNSFVFPEFYGDFWRSCALQLWNDIHKYKLTLRDGTPLKKHLKKKGIKNYHQFELHIKKIEDIFWNKRFPVYKEWREFRVEDYNKKGYGDSLFGFRFQGAMTKNKIINYPIQNAAFHCLLWSLTEIHNELKRGKWRTKIFGQIHDSIVAYVHYKELNDYLGMANEIMCKKIRKVYPFIITSLEIEADVAPRGGTWNDKKAYPIQ